MQIPPSLYKFQYLTYRPLFTPFFLLIHAIEFEHRRIAVLLSCKLLPAAIPNQNKLRLKQTFPQPSILILYFSYIDKLVMAVGIYGDPMVFGVAVFGKDVVEVDILGIEVQLLLKNEGLMSVLTLQYEGLLHFGVGSGTV